MGTTLILGLTIEALEEKLNGIENLQISKNNLTDYLNSLTGMVHYSNDYSDNYTDDYLDDYSTIQLY